jgi:ribosomal protein L29
VNQGIFVADTQTGTITKVARTSKSIADFLYWTFSGKPPGVREREDDSDAGELPRWRSSAFVSVSRDLNGAFLAAFKARQGRIAPDENRYINPVDGIFVGNSAQVVSLLDTTQAGQLLDPAAPAGSKISALDIERESFRGTWLAVTAKMLEPVSSESLAGIYLTNFPSPQPVSAGHGNSNPKPQLSPEEKKREINKLKTSIANLRKKLASGNRFKKQSLRLQIQELRQELAKLNTGS